MNINITRTAETISVQSPYSADFVKRCRQLNGKFNAPGKPDKSWTLSISLEAEVLAALHDCYGYVADAEQERITLKVTVHETQIANCAPVKFGPYELAKAWGRDSSAKPGQNVALISGSIRSGGSRKNWDSRVIAGAVFKLLDVPLSVADWLREIACSETFVDGYERVGDEEYPIPTGIPYWQIKEGRPEGCAAQMTDDGQRYFWQRPVRKQVFTVEEV